MKIKKIILIAFIALSAGIVMIMTFSMRIAYTRRNTVIEQEIYAQIEADCQTALSLMLPELTQSADSKEIDQIVYDKANAYLSSALAGTNYRFQIVREEDSIFQNISLSDSGRDDLNINGTPAYCGYFRLAGSRYYAIVWVHSDFYLAPLPITNTFIFVLLDIFLIAASIYFASLISKKITDPTDKLLTAIREAADGNLEAQCEVDSKNEIGELARNFNKMLHIISSNYDDLSSLHKELQANEEELRKNYDHIEFLAYHDVLTQLPNKVAFYDKVYNTLSSSEGSNCRHAVYFVDLDNFKTINDTLGHDYGDKLLAKTAERLRSQIKSNDVLSRAGGDEFLIFRANIPSIEDAVIFGRDVLAAFKEPFDLNGEIVYVTMSIGLSIYPENGRSHTVLIKNADIAMYRSKDTGKNKLTIFTSTMEEQIKREAEVLECLRYAIENKELYLVYQPQFRLSDNDVIGYETLMRINSAKLGPLSPAEFIPVAESNGLIYDLGLWSLREACKMNKNLLDRGYQPRTVAVNLSSLQLNHKEFPEDLMRVLQETGHPADLLELELTESMLVSSVTDVAKLLARFRSIGVRVSLDDFGTGYSSLNYLAKMPINTLKIDKSFIDNIYVNDRDSRMAESIISLAHSLGITVIAEGVENGGQLSLLRSLHCDLVQGYLMSKPLLPEHLAMLLN